MAHISQDILAKKIKAAGKKVAVGGTYVHYKDSVRKYKVRSLAVLEGDDSIVVVYQAQYGEKLTFIRPVESWLETVKKDGKNARRFKKVI